MTAHLQRTSTLDRVVGDNIKRLRDNRHWSAAELAKQLTEILGKDYSRFAVADLEGRRQRDIRWSELAALCAIFDVPLWDLVLPPEGTEVDTRVTYGAREVVELSDEPADDPDLARLGATKATVWYSFPQRDDLAWLFFGLDSETLTAEKLKRLKETRVQEMNMEDAVAVATAMLPSLKRGLAQDRSKREMKAEPQA